MQELEFRPLAEPDLELVSDWLEREHVRRWWRDPADIDAVRAKYLPRIGGTEPTAVFVALVGHRPVGLIQRYRFADYGSWAATVAGTELAFPSAAGIDYLIGEPDDLGHGLGAAMISAFTVRLFTDYPEVETVVVTPQHANRASCRALERAGYSLVWIGRLDSDDPADDADSAIYVRRRDATPPGGDVRGRRL